jgi:cation diffusion facilitator CzcD-associated flavoprotein CzcO
MDPAVRQIIGDIDYDPQELRGRYAFERDIRLRSDKGSQYVEMKAEFSHYADDPYATPIVREPLRDYAEVTVIGGGFSGLLAAARLRQQGFDDIRIIERGGDIGGTWYWNRYPGVRCDIESYIYMAMLEETGAMPSEKYARGSEIFDHLRALAIRFDLYAKACLQTTVTGLRWDDEKALWHIATDRGDDLTAKFVVMAAGLLDKPKLPGIPGIDRFKGHTFHSSRWDYGYTGGDTTGGLVRLVDKRVGIVGTGATAIQVIPYLAEWAERLYVFQRTPAAVDVRANKPTDSSWAASLEPGWQLRRIDNFNHGVAGQLKGAIDLVDDGYTHTGKFQDPTASWAADLIGRPLISDEAEFINEHLDFQKMNEIRARIAATVKDSATAEALLPWHRRWCKRPLFSDDYLPAFNRSNVTLVDTAGKGIESFTETGAVVAGKEYELDCLIFATGFETGTEYTKRVGYDLVGRNGLELSQYWRDGMKTFQGTFVRGFPNVLFIGYGQNAYSASLTASFDEQARHIAYTLSEVRKRGASIVEPTEKAVEDYVAEVRPLSASQTQFWRDCTPSYRNNEGDSSNPHGFFANVHPAGPIAFYQNLADWRRKNELEGLDLA